MDYPSEKEFNELKDKLFSIGCKMYTDWAEEKKEQGIIDPNYVVSEGIEKGDLGTAIGFVNQMMYTYDNVGWSFERIQWWGKEWLETNKRLQKDNNNVRKEEKHDESINSADDRFTSMDQILKEIEDLGDWKDPAEKEKYYKFMSKVMAIYYGCNIDGKNQYFPEVIDAIAFACKKSGKFPTKEEVFVNGKLAEGLEDGTYCNRVANFTSPLGISFIGERMPLDDIAKNEFGIDVMNLQMTNEEAKQLTESAQKYYKENFDKTTIPYYKVAKEALMNWNGMSEQEANDFIKNSSFEEIEAQVGAKKSIQYAIDGIAKTVGLSEYEKNALEGMVFEGKESIFAEKDIRNKVVEHIPVDVLMDTMASVHDGWVKDNESKFFKRDRKYQHMPFEMIGWKEAKSDLLFVKPIFDAMKVGISRPLEYDYNRRSRKFFLDRKITTQQDLIEQIQTGEQFYPALEGQNEILDALKDKSFVEEELYPQIVEKGIGNVENIREQIVQDVANNPNPDDLAKLSDDERDRVEVMIDEKISDEDKKNKADAKKLEHINKILEKAEKLNKMREENNKLRNEQNHKKDVPED